MWNFDNLVGRKFSELTVIERAENDPSGSTRWRCVCECGEEVIAYSKRLKSGTTKSCKSCTRKRNGESKAIDITGQKFGRLTAVRVAVTKRSQQKWGRSWECKCECGNVATVLQRNLTSGKTKSCGCLSKDHPSHSTHNKANTRMYRIWNGMKQRTRGNQSEIEKHKGYKAAGMCDRWYYSFENFYEDMHEGYRDDLSIDRIDNSKGYEPGNCRWADRLTQANNKSNNIVITYCGETKTLGEWCREKGLPRTTIYYRYKTGRTGEDLFAPIKSTKKGK